MDAAAVVSTFADMHSNFFYKVPFFSVVLGSVIDMMFAARYLDFQLDGYDLGRGFWVVFGDYAVDCGLLVFPKRGLRGWDFDLVRHDLLLDVCAAGGYN